MASIPGIRVTGTFVPTDTTDKFPVTDPAYQLGGWRPVASVAERNAIPAERRRTGMQVYVVATGETWALLGGTTDAFWVNATPTTGSEGGVTDGDKGVITVVGGAWGFDPTVVTPAAQTVLDDPTTSAMLTTLGAAPIASPAFTGDPTATNQAKADNTTKLATTFHVKSVVADYAPLASPALTGAPSAPTPAGAAAGTEIATAAYVKGQIDALVTGAPGTMDTLNEIAAALGDDPNFAATMTTQLATKLTNSINQDKIWTRTGAGTGVVEEITLSPFMRGLVDDPDNTTARTTLGLGTLATRAKTLAGDYTAGSVVMADLANVNQNTLVGRTAAGAGPPAAIAASADAMALLVAANYATMRDLLDVESGVNVLAFDTYLNALRGAANAVATFPWRDAAGVAAAHPLSALADTLLASNSAAVWRDTLDVDPGVNVLAYDAYLNALRGATSVVASFPWRNAAGTAAAHALSVLGDTLLASNSPAVWRNAINSGVTTLTDGSNITTDCSVDNVFQVTLAGTPRTLANPANVVVGATYNWFITQDGTGSRPLTLGSNFKLGVDSTGAAITYTPSTAAGAVDLISAVARTTTSLATAILKGVQ